MLVKSFLLGGIGTIILTLIFAEMVSSDATVSEVGWIQYLFNEAFLEAAIPEELFKFLLLYLIVWNSRHFDEYFDGIIYATFVSLGFACFENILYVFEEGVGTGIMRAITAVPGHFFFAVVMGYYFSIAKFVQSRSRAVNLTKAVLYPIILHGVYDSICFWMADMSGSEDDEYNGLILLALLMFIVFLVWLWKNGIKRIHDLMEKDKELIAANTRLVNDAVKSS